MPAAALDFVRSNGYALEIGANFSQEITFFSDAASQQPKNFTGYTFKMQIRDKHDSPVPILTLTQVNSIGDWIEVFAVEGRIIIHITNASTLLFKGGTYVYDLFGTSGPNAEKLLVGTIEVVPRVTK